MKFLSQSEPIESLKVLATSGRHSVLISGPKGSGKTYLAKQFASMLNISDFQTVSAKVDDIRNTISSCLSINNKVVICIENLDTGVAGAAYSLLKFLEEPAEHVYIVVTVRNIQRVPDTILSRSALVTTAPPTYSDIEQYSSAKNFARFSQLEHQVIWKCVKTFSEADMVMNLTNEQLIYFDSLSSITSFNDIISNMCWKLVHYNDNTEAPAELVIRYLMEIVNTSQIKRCGINCLSDISSGRIATHAAIAKFLFEMKYTTQ